jgi:SAM-dependent methyltransferase
MAVGKTEVRWLVSSSEERDDRLRLRATFDASADRYQRARPEYPPALFDSLIEFAQLQPGDQLLEIGCATGRATIPLAERGFAITGLELGPLLAAAGRRNLDRFENVVVVEADFEQWAAPHDTRFDLVFAATSWHWIDPAVRHRKAWEVLRPSGHLAVWRENHVFPTGGDPFFREIQEVYEEIGEGLPADGVWPTPEDLEDLEDQREEIEASGLFEDVHARRFDWATTYDASGYIDLLDTFSGHIAMEPWQRDRLYTEIRQRLARRPDGRLRRHSGAVLYVARRRD